MAKYPQRPSYSIFVRFRRSRLALRRGIPHLEEALAIAEQMRAGRFHDRDDVFVVQEPEGTIIELALVAPPKPPPQAVTMGEAPKPPPQAVTMGEAPKPPPQAVTMGEAPKPPPQAVTMGEAPKPPPQAVTMGEIPQPPASIPLSPVPSAPPLSPWPPASPPPAARGPASARRMAALFRLIEHADHVHRAMERAHAAQARFEAAFSAAEAELRIRGGSPPADLCRSQGRLGDVRASAVRSVASFERIAALVERRLAIALAEATRD